MTTTTGKSLTKKPKTMSSSTDDDDTFVSAICQKTAEEVEEEALTRTISEDLNGLIRLLQAAEMIQHSEFSDCKAWSEAWELLERRRQRPMMTNESAANHRGAGITVGSVNETLPVKEPQQTEDNVPSWETTDSMSALEDLADYAITVKWARETKALRLAKFKYNLADIKKKEMKRLMHEFGPERHESESRTKKQTTNVESVSRKFRRWFPLFFHWFYYCYKKRRWLPRIGVKTEKVRRRIMRAEQQYIRLLQKRSRLTTWNEDFSALLPKRDNASVLRDKIAI